MYKGQVLGKPAPDFAWMGITGESAETTQEPLAARATPLRRKSLPNNIGVAEERAWENGAEPGEWGSAREWSGAAGGGRARA